MDNRDKGTTPTLVVAALLLFGLGLVAVLRGGSVLFGVAMMMLGVGMGVLAYSRSRNPQPLP